MRRDYCLGKIFIVTLLISDRTFCIHHLNGALLKVYPACTSLAVKCLRKQHSNCLDRVRKTTKLNGRPQGRESTNRKQGITQVLTLAQWCRLVLTIHTSSVIRYVHLNGYIRLHWFARKLHNHASKNIDDTECGIKRRNDYVRWLSKEPKLGDAEAKHCGKIS
jgi:hypothetical protein